MNLFNGQRSNIEVTRPINAPTVNAQYLPKANFKLNTLWSMNSRIMGSAMTSKVKGHLAISHVMRLTCVVPEVENEKSQKQQYW